ncbi:MATH domain and coiled-coil domain-containing protein At3g58370-like [Brassica napus]|uniref:MATH domain and coiled-coil domain-containing protein At3g58370-like n=1 Tax=Brassica napus TaxID=3708 RepID=UPI0020787D5A|nr:MATH domain and coiled-coil domain-containing protein At3g58370-like [Brassica napus]
MVNEADNKFTWVIKDFSSLQSEAIISDRFLIGGYKWHLLVYPKRTHTNCLILGVATFESLPLREHAKFSVKLVNQISEKSSILREVKKWRVDLEVPLFGVLKLITFTQLHSKDNGLLVNDELEIVGEVDILQAIEGSQEAAQPKKRRKMDDYGTGSSDLHKETRVGNETVDVNGFQVSTSQVASVRCIFEKHPDFASKVRSNNQHLKSSYINVLLGLIETLCQLPEKLSDDDLDEASAAVSYLTQVGFKVDWLEEKLEEVREKKTKVYTGKAQLQHMEEEFKVLNKKCLELKDLVEKQNADVTAANVALSFSDVV